MSSAGGDGDGEADDDDEEPNEGNLAGLGTNEDAVAFRGFIDE